MTTLQQDFQKLANLNLKILLPPGYFQSVGLKKANSNKE